MENEKPTHEVRLGRIRATVWANHRSGEEAWYRVTTSRLYRAGDQWHVTQSFRPDDLPTLGKALDLAHDWLLSQGQGEAYRVEENGHGRGGHHASGWKNGGKRNGSKKQGKNKRAGGERTPMRQSKGGRSDSARGRERGRDASPPQN